MTTISKLGDEILVNTATVSGQSDGQVTTLANGNFVVTWEDFSQGVGGATGDTDGYAVKAQVFTTGGVKVGGEILVNTATAGSQDEPLITALSDGGFVVIWRDGSQGVGGAGGDTSFYAVKAQVFAAGGAKVGGEILVNTATAGDQSSAEITALSNGGFVVTWQDYSQGVGGAGGDTSLSAVKAQVFAANGTPVGSEILVNTVTTESQSGAQITALADGFVVTWYDYNGVPNEGDGYLGPPSLKAQLFAAGGSKVGGEILVSTGGELPQITTLSNGGFVVTWNDYGTDGAGVNSSAVKAQMFTAGGTPVGSEILVNTATANGQDIPLITALSNGGFVVTWRDYSQGVGGTGGDSSGYAVKAQVFAAGGSAVGSEILVNTATVNSQHDEQITALSDGGFVVTWNDGSQGVGGAGGDISNYAVKAQVFAADGTPIGSEILVNTATAGAQSLPHVTALPDGGFVVTWDDSSQGRGADISGYAVKAQVFNVNETPIAQAGIGSDNEDADITGQLVATDADAGDSLTYSLVADAAHGTVVVNTDGSYTYTPDASYNGSDSFTYKTNDGIDDSNTATVTLTVNAVNDAPVVNTGSAVLAYIENGAAAAIAPSATVTDSDSADFNGGSLTVAFTSGGTAADQLTIGNQGTGAGQISVGLGVVSYEGVAIGTFTGGSNGTALVVSFNSAAATPAAVQALQRDILYSNGSDNPSAAMRTVTFTVVDGDGTASGGDDTGEATATIDVSAENDAPTIGAFKSTYAVTRASTDATGVQGNDNTYQAGVFSPDGSKIAFHSGASNLVAGDTNNGTDIFIKDLTTGAVTRISVDANGAQANSSSQSPVFSPDGSKIAFHSGASNLVASDTNNRADIFIKDLTTGAVSRVSVDAAGVETNGESNGAVFSPDGSKIAFTSWASNLVAGDTNGGYDVFVKDLTTGAITRVSVDAAGAQGDGWSTQPVFSPDGSKIAFISRASNLVAGDTNGGAADIFVKDLTTGAITRVSVDAAGGQGDNESFYPVFSPDGSKIAFESRASNLVAGDSNGQYDIFVKDLATGAITRVSVDAGGGQANQQSRLGAFSPDGSKIVFYSAASNLVAGDTNDRIDIFVKDLTTGAVTRISLDAAGAQANDSSQSPVFSPDGSRIAFASGAANLVAGDSNGSFDAFVRSLTPDPQDPAVYVENGAPALVNTLPVTISDLDNSNFGGGSLTAALTAGSHAGDGLTLIVSTTPGSGIELSGSTVSYNGTTIGTLSGSGTASLSVALNATADAAAVAALAGAVAFSSTSDAPADTRTVTFTLVDGSGGTDTGSFTQTVQVTAVNDAPTASNLTQTLTVAEDATPPKLFTIAPVVADIDSASVTATLTLSNPAAGVLVGFGTGVAGVYTLSGALASVNAVLAAVTFDSAQNFSGTLDVAVAISDGFTEGPQGTNPSGTVSITVTPVNDEPTLTATANNPTYVENSSRVTLFSGAAVSTIEAGQTISSMTLTVSGLANGVNELLFIDGSNVALTNANSIVTATNGLTVNVNVTGNTATATFTGANLSESVFQTLVNTLGYSVAGDTPTAANRTVRITEITDSGSNTAPSDNTTALNIVSTVAVTAVNDAPTVNRPAGANVSATRGQTFQVSSLFSGSDVDSATLTYYLYDGNSAANSGRFMIGGNAIAAGTIVQVTAAQLAQATFVAGAAGTSDSISVQAFDGAAYSGWNAIVNVSVPPNRAPTVSTPAGTSLAPTSGQTMLVSNLFRGNDLDGDTLTYYLYDGNSAANSGRFMIGGNAVAAGTIVPVTAAQLAQATFVAGAAGTSDSISVQAFDGTAYSGWNAIVNLAVPAGTNHAPTVSRPAGTSLAPTAGQTIQVSSLFSGNDADGNTLTYYLYDGNSAANSGHFMIGGNAVAAGTIVPVTAAQLAQATFVAGAAGTFDDIFVQAFDGQLYSGWTTGVHVGVPAGTNHAPTVGLPAGSNMSPTAGQTMLVSSLFSGSDVDGHTLTYYLYDANGAANSGHFVVNGVIVPAQTIQTLTAAQLAQATYVAGAAGTSDDIYVNAFDGQLYSGWNTRVHMDVPAGTNHAPTVNLPSGNSANPAAGQTLQMSSLFSGSDVDGNSLTYFVYDSNSAANSGHVVIGGNIVAAQTITPMTAAQLAQATFVAGDAGTSDDIFVQAFDGQLYSGWTTGVHLFV